MILNVHHSTVYSYTEAVRQSVQILRLTPVNHARQKVIEWDLKAPGITTSSIDWFGNITNCLTLPESRNEIEITAIGRVKVLSARPNSRLGTLHPAYYLRTTPLANLNQEMKDFAFNLARPTAGWASLPAAETLKVLVGLSRDILANVPYIRGTTNSATSATAAFNLGSGVCQDHTHIFLACARFLGISARYVSGYLHTDDASHLSSHAWAEAWVDGAWHSFDISNQCPAGEQHIELAYGLDYLDASPIRGSRVGGGQEQLVVFSLVTDQETQ